MAVLTLPAPSASTPSERVAAAGRRMYDGEIALHAARQTHVDAWIVAASEKLHIAIAEHTAAVHANAA